MKTIKHLIRVSIAGAIALVTVCLVTNVASADTVNATYNSATNVPVVATNYTATGNTVNFTLNYAPDMAITHVHVHDDMAGLYPTPPRRKMKSKTT